MAMIKKVRNISEMDASAKTLSTKTEGAPPGTPEQKTTNGVSFPSGPVKVGDTWEGTSTSNGKDMKVQCKLAGVSTVDGKEIATIEATPDTQVGMTLDGPLNIQIDLANGMTYSMTMKGTAPGPDGKPMQVMMEMKQK